MSKLAFRELVAEQAQRLFQHLSFVEEVEAKQAWMMVSLETWATLLLAAELQVDKERLKRGDDLEIEVRIGDLENPRLITVLPVGLSGALRYGR